MHLFMNAPVNDLADKAGYLNFEHLYNARCLAFCWRYARLVKAL